MSFIDSFFEADELMKAVEVPVYLYFDISDDAVLNDDSTLRISVWAVSGDHTSPTVRPTFGQIVHINMILFSL